MGHENKASKGLIKEISTLNQQITKEAKESVLKKLTFYLSMILFSA